MRTIVDLTDEQVRQLNRICARKRISRAEAVRRGIDLLLAEEGRKDEDFRRALDAAFGMWRDRGIDALEYERAIRSEWDRKDEA